MDRISARGELTIKPDKAEEFEELARSLVRASDEGEPGTLELAFYLNEAGTVCVAQEVYADSDAALHHLNNVGAILGKIPSVADLTAFEVYGDPSPQLSEIYEGFNAVVYRPLTALNSRD